MSVIRLDDVGKAYPTAAGPVRVLKHVRLAIEPGEFCAITGPSGCGKTTLLNLAALLDVPTEGAITCGGRPVTGLDHDELAALRGGMIGMIFQKFCLLPHRTTLENIVFGARYTGMPRADAESRARELAERLGLSGVAAQPARLLSGGEMQRTAIARALINEPKMLVADEPTGNLDAASAAVVMDLLRACSREGLSVLLVTHNQHLLHYASTHYECREGALHRCA